MLQRRIALMTQWTEFDAGAERVALQLAGRARRPLTVIVPLFSNPELEVVAPARVADAEAATARAAAAFEARVRTAGLESELCVRRGDELWREVVDAARAARADFVVTRRRGHRGFLGQLRVGEMVREVAAHSPCPLLMVPRAAELPARRALVVLDSPAAVDAAVPPASALAALLGLELEMVAVAAPDAVAGAGWLQRAQGLLQRAAMRAEGTVVAAPLVDAVSARLAARSIDLLVLGVDPGAARHGRLGPAVEAIVGGAPCATLLVRPQASHG